ncbi:MAG: hypothetical protein ACI9I0_002126 [Rhodoferax sp.]|jgi:hypothetical protein
MAIGLMTVLKIIPWVDVIRNAPVVADGAKKLWSTVGKKTPLQEMPESRQSSSPTTEPQAIGMLQARLTAMEATTSDLHQQMLASSALITSLAEQNSELIKRVEANRVRVLWLSLVTLVSGALAVASLLA